ncbi:dehydration-responsive element-binding protein 1F-like [Prosopis cineraria]|uniref:dehydration-responsive element-binding protein 1F-like n=1 Tax=Prosopis cineraria TaxID=364024 RepID=UPI00240EE406|nr:dehydration-responsive element-binding protein 1F-like [Prosopis cineraria]
MDFENGSCPSSAQNPSSPTSQIASRKKKAGRKKFQETRHPLFRGVRRRNGDRWVCEVREPNKKSRIWLGTYRDPEMAARAHDVAALALRGSSATLNFPNLAQLLPAATSSSAQDIRTAAAEAAHAFKPTASSSLRSSPSPNAFPAEDEEKSNDKLFFDEEALYNMPSLLDHMAEGLLLSPPSMCSKALGLALDDDFTLPLTDTTAGVPKSSCYAIDHHQRDQQLGGNHLALTFPGEEEESSSLISSVFRDYYPRQNMALHSPPTHGIEQDQTLRPPYDDDPPASASIDHERRDNGGEVGQRETWQSELSLKWLLHPSTTHRCLPMMSLSLPLPLSQASTTSFQK